MLSLLYMDLSEYTEKKHKFGSFNLNNSKKNPL